MTVEELIAREEVRQCVLRHFRAVDRIDERLERGAFWGDGHFVGGPIHGPMDGAIPDLFAGLLPTMFDCTCHYIANLVTTVAGDDARVEASGVGYHLIAEGEDKAIAILGATAYEQVRREGARYELLIGVRYAIRLSRRDGVWKIATMAPIVDWTRARRAAPTGEEGLVAAIAGRGRRDRGDATYFDGDWAP